MTPTAALRAALADPETGWGLGVLGALGEFCRDADEAMEAADGDGGFRRVTPRGGIAIRLDHPALRLIAWEEPSPAAGLWRQGAGLCLPEAAAAIGGAEAVTELGPDAEALRPADRAAILFDMGVGFAHCRACVRTRDPGLLAALRQGLGQPLFTAGNPAGPAILAASPHRVFLSRLARIEVYQPIPPPMADPPSARIPICCPACCAPAAPMGRPGRCQRDGSPAWTSFPPIRCGMRWRRRVPSIPPATPPSSPCSPPSACPSCRPRRPGWPRPSAPACRPPEFTPAADRHGRAAARITLRQLGWTEPSLPALPAWQAALEPAAG